MASNREIRVPRTTALFVHGLARILRGYFQLYIYEHEHWTFTHVAGWQGCGRPGLCSIHGFSPQDPAGKRLDAALEAGEVYLASDLDRHARCDPYHVNVYLGVGLAPVRRPLAFDLRTRIEEVRFDDFFDFSLFVVRLWIRNPGDNTIRRGAFSLHPDGSAYRSDEPIRLLPPERISFWKDTEQKPVQLATV